MNNLVGKDLKKCFYDCLKEVVSNSAELNVIKFKFSSDDGYKFKPVVLDYDFGYFCFNDVSFLVPDEKGTGFLNINDLAIKIIVQNLHFDHFALIDKIHIEGKRECYGHGDYWCKDSFVFIFHRFKEGKDNE